MNEQLTVKNFGPIKDATVDFKRVTVFIGPTGGGKSTLAKLICIYRESRFSFEDKKHAKNTFSNYLLSNYFNNKSSIVIQNMSGRTKKLNKNYIVSTTSIHDKYKNDLSLIYDVDRREEILKSLNKVTIENLKSIVDKTYRALNSDSITTYIPSERMFSSSIEYSWPGLLRDDIGLPKILLNFSNIFTNAKRVIESLEADFINLEYIHKDNIDYIKIPNSKKMIRLNEAASGVQSLLPLMIVIEYLTKEDLQIHSFIIEEPELNLYPTAQQGLMNWLVEKCTAGENDLTITTHSPYILASCNLLMEAYKVWQDRPELAAEIEKIVPRASWINPDEFSAYYVADGTVRSIQDERTDLIGGNELDAVSGQISDAFRKLLRLKKQPA
ncbi:hypothetical protein D0T11_19805 [Hymenobacter rubripertinctus]|uniref:Endonuclease GajA/Old nuclease/RecF-like AAA domain-containing protein n=2 Tax=Hymenobacter rubripertinctus TaxID=2029981 RepID=A0A418QKX3_9BACT|nr:hypothetical protein D0T11_19805 [Hymenobacter rubripertinctus]